MCKLEKCAGRHCLLNYIYPNTDASLACDSECYLENEGEKHQQWYIDHFPEKVESFNNTIKAEANGK